MITLETPRLLLRKGVLSDWPAMYRNLWRHPESARYMLWNVTTDEADAPARMERTIAFQTAHPYAWQICEKATGQAIGFAGLEERGDGLWEDGGVALGPDFTGRGYGTEVLNALVDFAHWELGASTFLCSCRTANIASHRLQMRCGFRFSHTEERTDPHTGQPYTLEFNTLSLDSLTVKRYTILEESPCQISDGKP